MSCLAELEISSPIMVDAQIQRWTICSDDIYLMKFHEAPPAWLEDIIENIMNDSGLVDSVADLEARFANFEEGYTEHFYDWYEGDKHTLAKVENMYVTNSVFNAGIQDIKVTYVSKDESGAYFDFLMGAWQTGAGGAWFNERVSVVSNVAYSAAKSVSTLTATIQSQNSAINDIIANVDELESQVDGKIETWKGTYPVVNPDGTLIDTAEPYATWLAAGTLNEHTGDTYLHTGIDQNGKETLIGIYRFSKDTTTNLYNWYILEDDLAATAYQQALDAGALADGKINSYYQPSPPTIIEDPTMGEGDLWVDSDDDNKMYRYNGSNWLEVRDRQITASVDRLDEATVTIGGLARAKSSLVVSADGVVSGYVAEADNSTWSSFQIFADKFYISGAQGSNFSEAPFSIDTTKNKVKFNGVVEFSNVDGSEDILQTGDAADDINRNVTLINGGKITTGSIDADRLSIDSIWSRGSITSPEWSSPSFSGYVSNYNSTGGFFINARAGIGTYNYPNIFGSYIRGSYIAASVFKFTGAKFEAETEYGSTGKLSYMASGDYSFPNNTSGEVSVTIGTVVGPSHNAGSHDARRVLSRAESFLHVKASFWYHAPNQYCTAKIQFSVNGGAWKDFKAGRTGPGTNFPNLSGAFPIISYIGYSDYLTFRALLIIEGGTISGGKLDGSLQLNN